MIWQTTSTDRKSKMYLTNSTMRNDIKSFCKANETLHIVKYDSYDIATS